jgi:hypothetical protein
MEILLLLVWWVLGVIGFLYWWTSTDDFTTKELPWMLVFGLYGPFTFIIGYNIHGKKSGPKVIIKKRGD